MDKVSVIEKIENDIKIPNSTKYSSDTANVFVYNVDGEFDEKAEQAIVNTIEAHGGRNGFTALVTFNTNFTE